MYEQRLSLAAHRIRLRVGGVQPLRAAKLLRRHESMRSFERVHRRVLMIGSAGVALAMILLVGTTTHLLG